MIERQTIGDREATVAYLTSGFSPAPKAEAEVAKVIFDDGEMIFLVIPRDARPDPGTTP